MGKILFRKNVIFQRLPGRIRTRFLALLALILSVITFVSGLSVFLYMKTPNFENQLVAQVMKHLGPIINYEIEKSFEERNSQFKVEP
jgi:hypothetical protein